MAKKFFRLIPAVSKCLKKLETPFSNFHETYFREAVAQINLLDPHHEKFKIGVDASVLIVS
jgi:hypothetical protein